MINMENVSLVKGQKIDLTKGNEGLDKIAVGLGWDVNETNGSSFDLDASVYETDKENKSKGIVYFGNLKSNGIEHQGDNLTGEGDGDDEVINVELSKVSEGTEGMHFVANIYQANAKGQNFGQVKNAYIRIVDLRNNEELCKFDLSEDYSANTGVIAGKIYRHNGEWKFEATGKGVDGDLNEIKEKL